MRILPIARSARWPLLDIVVAAGLLVAVPVGPARGQQQPSESVDLGLYAGPLRFEAADGGVLELGDGRRFTGVLEARLAADGSLVLVNDVDIETYVEGIAEMPARWPLDALKAQAVAARTYAWYQASRNAFDGYDICSTTACQVFRGREVVETPEVGDRWARAVAQTEGQVLLHDGEPILARYFSTSGGHTFNNEDVFPSSGAFPYLIGVPDPDDAVSPLHTWTAAFTREQFDEIAARGSRLPTVVPVASVERIPQPDPTPDRIVVTGQNANTVNITAGELRDFLNLAAPTTHPDKFPGLRDNGIDRLPSTVPSGRYEVEVTPTHIVLHGSGWGHGVGMGQYGALGKAERGLTHAEILAAYYNGLEPTTTDRLPRRMRVGLSGIDSEVTITSTSVFTVTTGDQVVVERGLGTFRVREGAQRTLGLMAPPGHGAPLVLSSLALGRTQPFAIERVALDVVANKPVELELEATPTEGGEPVRRPLGVVEPGRQHVTWDLDNPKGEPVATGAWEVSLVAVDENGERLAASAALEILQPTPSGPNPTLLSVIGEGDSMVPVLVAVGAGATLLGFVAGRRPRRREDPDG
jgi:SpoIID/LytB domain protein